MAKLSALSSVFTSRADATEDVSSFADERSELGSCAALRIDPGRRRSGRRGRHYQQILSSPAPWIILQEHSTVQY